MSYDVVIVGEPLLEFSATRPLALATTFELSFSGDALNAAVAAVAAEARVGLLTRLGRDELSDRLVSYLASRGVDTSLVRREDGQTGAYVLGADPTGTREFAYLRAGSAATRLEPSDVDFGTKALLISGITAALSPSCAATVLHAAAHVRESGGIVVYDPNFRGRLTTADDASTFSKALAPYVSVALPSAPADTRALFGLTDPDEVAAACHELGVPCVVVTRGSDGVMVSDRGVVSRLPAVPTKNVLDSTGAGDCFAGMLTARLALGDALLDAVRLGMAAASLSLGGKGGTGLVPTLEQTRAHAGGRP